MLPSDHQWKKDSFVGSLFKPKRRDDKALLRIDRMVKSLNKPQSSGEYAYKVGGLFFTTMYWNNNHKINPKMDSGRRDSIMRLNLFAGNKLAQVHSCGVGQLAAKLQQMYGKSMSQHGIDTDADENPKYLNAAQRERFRVVFRNGLAYWFNPDLKRDPNLVLKPWDTTNTYEADKIIQDKATGEVIRSEARSEGVSYAFSMSNELYAMQIRGSGLLDYHSSFMAGMPVQCAGVIAMTQGVITRIRNDSGHYKPNDQSLAQVLRHFKTIGVDITKITVEEEVKGGSARGDQFLQANGNWAAVLRPHTPAPRRT